MNNFNILLLFITFFILSACSNNESSKEIERNSQTKRVFTLNDYKQLNKINTKLRKPKPGDWLYFKKEKGQTFKNYVNSNPVIPTIKKNKIYILPIGIFNNEENVIINETAEFMHLFFNLDVIIKERIPSFVVPKSARRYNNDNLQLNTKYILYNILKKEIPKDAIVYIAITADDLYPADDWNFVFGQASLMNRVGISSIFRLKYDSLNLTNYNLFLKRIAETTTHETCHMFSMLHCKDYKCMMNGSMNLEEADSKPLHLCPECLAKLVWCTNQDVIERYNKLEVFFNKHNFKKEAIFCKSSKKTFLESSK